MRTLLLLLISVTLLSSCINKSETQARKSGQEIYFNETTHDYGDIIMDSDGSYKFIFKNLGEDAILINRVRSTCGCTIPSWPREPIEPGEEGKIEVKYNTALAGMFMKSIYVYSSANNSPNKLVVKGKVVEERIEH